MLTITLMPAGERRLEAMTDKPIRFDDGAAYETYMGLWSQQAGAQFLDWLQAAPGQHWVDVGCGNGAFTQLLLDRCQPAGVQDVDPSPEQIAFAQGRFASGVAHFQTGDAMALPLPDQSATQAVMALVIFFVPEPERGVAEMARVLQPGGTASAYAWDILGGFFPWAAMQRAFATVGRKPNYPPSVGAANLDALQSLWTGAGFTDVQTDVITVQRSFKSFDDYWATGILGPSMVAGISKLNADELKTYRDTVRQEVGDGPMTISARAHAVKGRKPL